MSEDPGAVRSHLDKGEHSVGEALGHLAAWDQHAAGAAGTVGQPETRDEEIQGILSGAEGEVDAGASLNWRAISWDGDNDASVDDQNHSDANAADDGYGEESRLPELVGDSHAPVDLASLQEVGTFSGARLAIHIPYKLLLCIGCGVGLEIADIGHHLRGEHGGDGSVPVVVAEAVEASGIPNKAPHPGTGTRLVPVPYIPVQDGFCCSLPDCHYAAPSFDSVRNNHTYLVHLDRGNRPASDIIAPCLVQRIFARRGRTWWAVSTHHSYPVEDAAVIGYLQSVLDDVSAKAQSGDGTVQPVSDARQIPQWVRRLGWIDECKDLKYADLSALACLPDPAAEPVLHSLRGHIEAYFQNSRQDIVSLPIPLRKHVMGY